MTNKNTEILSKGTLERRKQQLKQILSNPRNLFDIIQNRNKAKKVNNSTKDITSNSPFSEVSPGLEARQYSNSETYRNHQSMKYEVLQESLEQSFEQRVSEFEEHFSFLADQKASSILCLGARDGAEVKALRNLGLLAIGIDLAYASKSPFVHFGDFHNISYPNHVFDYVYTNTLDHMQDPSILLGEIKRILKPSGKFLAQILNGTEEGYDELPGDYESFVWKKKQDLIDLIQRNGLSKTTETQVTADWWMYSFNVL